MSATETLLSTLNRAVGPWIARASAALAPLRQRYQKAEPREKMLLRIGGVALGIFLAYNLFYLPIQNYQDELQTRIETRHRELGEVSRLVLLYQERKVELQSAEKNTVPNTKEFSLFSVVEKSLTTSIGHDKIASITPAEDRKLSDGMTQYSVDLKLQAVSLAQLVDALYGVKTLSSGVAVSTLRVTRRQQDPHTFDVDMTCIALAKGA